jgi:ribonuclease HI
MDQPDGQPGLVIYTDGACESNPGGPGGWGFLILEDGRLVREECGGTALPTTSNRMELLAVIMALESLPAPTAVTVRSDSRYVVSNAKLHLRKWKRNGWKTSAKNGHQPVKNQDLWQRLDQAAGPHRVEWQHVRGHAGEPGNEGADELATRGMENAVLESPESRAGSSFTWPS